MKDDDQKLSLPQTSYFLGDYRITFGPFAGKQIKECVKDELEAYCQTLDGSEDLQASPLKAIASKYYEHLSEGFEPTEDDVPFDF